MPIVLVTSSAALSRPLTTVFVASADGGISTHLRAAGRLSELMCANTENVPCTPGALMRSVSGSCLPRGMPTRFDVSSGLWCSVLSCPGEGLVVTTCCEQVSG